jgi:hypothetical protein
MTTQMLATIIDHSISIVGGILAMLVGFRVVGPAPKTNPKYEAFYEKWAKHLKWLGPVIIGLALVQIAVALLGRT